jgi:hypothetical protein
MIEMGHEQRVISFYIDRTDEFYLNRWDSDDIHFGIFRTDESIDWTQYRPGGDQTIKRALSTCRE